MQLNLDGEVAAPHSPFECTPPSSPWQMVEEEPTEEQSLEEQAGEAAMEACVEAARGLVFRPYAMCKARRTLDIIGQITGEHGDPIEDLEELVDSTLPRWPGMWLGPPND